MNRQTYQRLPSVLVPVLYLFTAVAAQAAGPVISSQIIIDEFGYRTASHKIAIFANPIKGQNSNDHFVPGATFQLRKQSDDSVALEAPLVQWKNGQVDPISGDQVWMADFSKFSTPGEYYLFDAKNNARSSAFKIDDHVYDDVLKAAVRMFYYQRSGIALTEKYAGKWTHPASHVGPKQTRQAMPAPLAAGETSRIPNVPRDVSGGWQDAGDYNKYIPFLATTVWDLLSAYDENPSAFTDDYNIPESGNSVPDILDEIKWELDWMLKMQNPDGSVCNRVAEASYNTGSGPDKDTQPQFVTQPTTWATSTFAALTAHASKTLKPFDTVYAGYSAKLLAASQRAWKYLDAHATMLPASGKDGSKLAAADGDCDAHTDGRLRVYAAAELFCATGDAVYRNYFDRRYNDIESLGDQDFLPVHSGHTDPLRASELNCAFADYCTAAGATSSIANKVKTPLGIFVNYTEVPAYRNQEDPYLGYMWEGHYSWGSNRNKATWANMLLEAIRIKSTLQDDALFLQIAEEYLHYFHGRNAMSMCYLSNMGLEGANLGASRSVMHFYHGWFNNPIYGGADSKIGPAPGYLVGGPNKAFTVNWISPPFGEPAAKAFKDWNGGWNTQHNANENSWEITEPAIYYQAAYVHLLSHFCHAEK